MYIICVMLNKVSDSCLMLYTFFSIYKKQLNVCQQYKIFNNLLDLLTLHEHYSGWGEAKKAPLSPVTSTKVRNSIQNFLFCHTGVILQGQT